MTAFHSEDIDLFGDISAEHKAIGNEAAKRIEASVVWYEQTDKMISARVAEVAREKGVKLSRIEKRELNTYAGIRLYDLTREARNGELD